MLKKIISSCAFIVLFVSFNAQAQVKIYAASSLTNVMNALISEFNTQYDIEVLPIYAGSSSLARQIERGAPADIFISANERWMQHLVQKGSVKKDQVVPFTQNQLVLISPAPLVIASFDIADNQAWQEHLSEGRLAIGNPRSVPAGIYAQQSLTSLHVWREIKSSTAPTSNVRMALALVERKEAPLGIVYKTDALLSNKVNLVAEFPTETHDPIRYPLAVINATDEVLVLSKFLQSEDAQNILSGFGFLSSAQ